jgi:type VI secretion system VasD/TssJ family lipoprotein
MKTFPGLAAAALGLACLLAGCASGSKMGDLIKVTVEAGADLNADGGAAQPVMFQVLAMKDPVPENDLILWDGAKLASVGKVVGDEASTFIWPGKTVPMPPLRMETQEQFGYVAIVVSYPRKQAKVVELNEDDRPGYSYVDGEHRLTFLLGKNSIQVSKP